jgi:exopolysaccharide biosynthesis polyprenyl glycosylphosphotransferase
VSEQIATSAVRRHAELPLWVEAHPVPPGTVRTEAAWTIARGIADCSALAIAAIVDGGRVTDAIGVTGHAALAGLLLIGLVLSGSYRRRLRLRIGAELRRVLASSALAVMLAALVGLATTSSPDVGDPLILHWVLAAGLLTAGRLGLFGAHRFTRTRLHMGTPTLVVGAGQVGQLTAKRLLDQPHLGLRPVGFLDKEPLDEDGMALAGQPYVPVLGASWDLGKVVRDRHIGHVIIAFSTAPHHVLLGIVRECWRLRVNVSVVPRLFEVEGRRLETEHLGALPLVGLSASDPQSFQFAIKYAIDRVLAAIALIAVAPLMAIVAAAVRLTMGGPVLFRQERVGRDGRAFQMLKFRTMELAPAGAENDAAWAARAVSGSSGPAPAPVQTATEDRRTPVGSILRKLSLDELPQLWNVLRGDMALVGPRPERVAYVDQFADVIYRYPDRHRVKAGLTGWAQVNGLRGETSLADRIEWDNFYIENWTPWLDVKILVMTLPALFGRRGGH